MFLMMIARNAKLAESPELEGQTHHGDAEKTKPLPLMNAESKSTNLHPKPFHPATAFCFDLPMIR